MTPRCRQLRFCPWQGSQPCTSVCVWVCRTALCCCLLQSSRPWGVSLKMRSSLASGQMTCLSQSSRPWGAFLKRRSSLASSQMTLVRPMGKPKTLVQRPSRAHWQSRHAAQWAWQHARLPGRQLRQARLCQGRQHSPRSGRLVACLPCIDPATAAMPLAQCLYMRLWRVGRGPRGSLTGRAPSRRHLQLANIRRQHRLPVQVSESQHLHRCCGDQKTGYLHSAKSSPLHRLPVQVSIYMRPLQQINGPRDRLPVIL